MVEMLRNSVIPEPPMFKPEFPPQEAEHGVVIVDEDGKPENRVKTASECLPHYDPASCWTGHPSPFRYWKIRDYAHAYRSKLTTPSMVAEHIISVIEFNHHKPPTPSLVPFDDEEIRKQAAASTRRFEEGNSLLILDGIFMAIKDDIDCKPHPSMATTWMHEVRAVKKDAVSVSRLRSCGVVFIGKANMHKLGMGTTGNNAHFGKRRNPHAPERYTGGSSSVPAAIIASGLCSAALGTDGGGSIHIPSSLCSVAGLKTTYGRTDMEGSLCNSGTVEIIGPIASSVEDVMLVYAAILGSSPADRISLKPSPPCLPIYQHSTMKMLWNHCDWRNTQHGLMMYSTDISDKCEDILKNLSKTHGCETVERVIPELHGMRTAHLVSIGAEVASALNPDCDDGKGVRLSYRSRANLALFRSFTA